MGRSRSFKTRAASCARSCSSENKSSDVDLAVDGTPELGATRQLEGVEVISLEDPRASKLTCLLSRSEPRDLVDVLFLERAGFPADQDLELALKKDAGVDPAVMGWLLDQFPVAPLP